jgi:hypothetical protein
MEFERKLALIHEARDNGVVIDFSSDFLDLAPVEEERLLYKDEAQLYGRFCQEVSPQTVWSRNPRSCLETNHQ